MKYKNGEVVRFVKNTHRKVELCPVFIITHLYDISDELHYYVMISPENSKKFEIAHETEIELA